MSRYCLTACSSNASAARVERACTYGSIRGVKGV
jgi:hypothetical protein